MSEDPRLPEHEETEASPRAVAAIAAALVLLVAVGIIAGIATVRHATAGVPFAAPATTFANGATFRPDAVRSWERYEADSTVRLAGYAWIDRSAGRVRIPLERAMDVVADEEKETRK